MNIMKIMNYKAQTAGIVLPFVLSFTVILTNTSATLNTSCECGADVSPSLRHHNASDVIHDATFYRLEENLLRNYRPHLRPVRSHRTVTNVSLYIQVVAVHEVNEAYQTLRHSSWLSMTWKDEFLTWDPADYDGLDTIELPERMIWTPTVSVSNSGSGDVFFQNPTAMYTRVGWDGTIVWVPISVKETLCSLDITYYPFDSQDCSVVLGMWSSPENEVLLTVQSTQLDPAYYVENSEWRLTGVTEESFPFEFQGQLYSKYHVSFHLKRRRLFHCLTLIVPNVLLALLAGLVFALPQECGEKMSFSMSLLLAFAVNLSVLVTAMPRSSLQVSLLMIYLTSLSVATGLSVVCTVCLLRVYHKVGVVGPKVTAFTLSLRNLFGLRQHYDVTVDGDDAHRQHDDKDLRHECQKSNVIGTQENDVLSNEWVSPDMINFSSGNECKQQKNLCNLTNRLLVRTRDPQRQVPVTWKTVAVTLDWLCCRVFVFVIVAMTSALVVALFIGP